MTFSKIYPQDATNALSSVLRQDEQAGMAAEQTDLAAKQQIGTIGETIPLVFARRRDNIGGTWVSPKLIQLGVRQTDISLLYVLSQGRVSQPTISNVYYGYTPFSSITNGQICAAYQAAPPCVNLDYNPGGSTSWNTTLTYGGPGMPGSGSSAEFTTRTSNCVSLNITFNGSCKVSVPTGNYVVENNFFKRGASEYGWPPPLSPYDPGFRRYIWDWQLYGIPVELILGGRQCVGRTDTVFNRNVGATVRSEVRFSYSVVNTVTNATVQTGSVWIPDGGTSITLSNLPAASYRVVFHSYYAERTYGITPFVPIDWNSFYIWDSYSQNAPFAWRRQNDVLALDNTFRRNIAGSVSESFSVASITETVNNTLNFPAVPGGQNQQSGGYTDLTLLGARGHYDSLRPATGPNQFTQIHAFLTEGVQVAKLLENRAVGASDIYPDLVYYLMSMAGMLQADQIDLEGLTQSARFNDRYKLRFNGVLNVTVNFREWLSRTAPYFLLSPRQLNGKFGLTPVVPTNADGSINLSATTPVATFDATDIVKGSFRKAWVPANERKPFVAVMVYREQPTGTVGQSRTVEVRYNGLAASGPYEQHDLTEFCCTPEHAIYAARYILAKRRYTSHTVSFRAGRKAAQLIPGQIIAVSLSVESSRGEGFATNTLYQIDQLNESGSGTIEVNATEFPVNSNGVSRVAYDVAQGDVVILQ